MKGKILYFWNDLGIYFPQKTSEIEEIEKDLQIYFTRISQVENIKYKFLSLQDTRMWFEKMKEYMKMPSIYIGTRPNMLFTNRNKDSIAIYPQRKRSFDGRTETSILSESDKKLIEMYTKKTGTIRIVEDVLVCGITMDKLLKELEHSLVKGQNVTIDLFLENKQSSNKIEEKYGNTLHMQCFYEMQGESISESTCICAYDLLDGKFKDMEYDECIKKLKYFFGQSTYEILERMKSIKDKLLFC